MKIKIKYNSPVVLSYALIAIAVLVLCSRGMMASFFSSPSKLVFSDPLVYLRLISYVAGHSGWSHLTANFMMILLVGPLLEEKYGSGKILEMMMITAAATALLNAFFFSSSIMGGSGIAFMLILLGSFSGIRSGEIPLTFIIISVLFIGGEVVSSLRPDGISQFSHLAGGLVGAAYGFIRS